MRSPITGSAIALAVFSGWYAPAHSGDLPLALSQVQAPKIGDAHNLNRAKNLARMAAEKANGGLNRYRAENFMHGPVEGIPDYGFQVNALDDITFQFLGGSPGSALNSIETAVQVRLEADNWSVEVLYNGPPRPRILSQRQTMAQDNAISVETTRRSALKLADGNVVEIGEAYSLNRAKNLARMAAEKTNGGLSQYRSQGFMHGPTIEIPAYALRVNNPNSVAFIFLGGPPGTDLAAVESEVLVSRELENWDIEVLYNGPPRETTLAQQETPGQETGISFEATRGSSLTRAKNLARMAAEQANGGLRFYRAEAFMHGPVVHIPSYGIVVSNPNSVTFTFLGGTPGEDLDTIESQVLVTQKGKAWDVQVIYNGTPRPTTLAQRED